MVNVVRFPSASNAQEEAAQWVARLDRGLSDEERAELGGWLEADSRRRDLLLELAGLWDELNVLSELSALFPLEQPQRTTPRRRSVLWAAAASVAGVAVVLAFSAPLLNLRSGVEAPPVVATAPESFRTTIGSQAEERLADGSRVRLNTDTEIEVIFTDTSRRITLRRGEAHFDVARDPARPFSVRVGDRVVQAVGTAFNVRLKGAGEVEVIVTEGEVRLGRVEQRVNEAAAPRAPTPVALFEATLTAGQAALLAAPELSASIPRITRLGAEDIDVKLAWQRGALIFQGEPLDEVLAEFTRYTTTEFVLEDELLGKERVGGTLAPGEIDELLGLLHDNLGIDSERIEGERILLRAAAGNGRPSE